MKSSGDRSDWGKRSAPDEASIGPVNAGGGLASSTGSLVCYIYQLSSMRDWTHRNGAENVRPAQAFDVTRECFKRATSHPQHLHCVAYRRDIASTQTCVIFT